MVSLFEVLYVFFVNFRTRNSKTMPRFIRHVQFFLAKLNFYFHECDSREPKVRNISLCVKCCKQFVFVFLEFGSNDELDHSRLPYDQGYNSKNKKGHLLSKHAVCYVTVAHGPDMPMLTPSETLDTSPPDSEYDVSDCDDVDFQPTTSSEPQFFTKSELNCLVRDPGFPKDCAEISESRLQSKNLVTQVHHFRGT
jgi:hypothetical protein